MTPLTESLKQSVVVFSKNYLPISRVNIKRAITLLLTDKAEPLDFISHTSFSIRSQGLVLQVPSLIRLKINSVDRTFKVPPVSRKEILRRDKYQCQYCACKKHLTIDHVIPRSRGGQNIWENVVIACASCNSRKGDRTPNEAGMKLLSQPKVPIHPTLAFAEDFWSATNKIITTGE